MIEDEIGFVKDGIKNDIIEVKKFEGVDIIRLMEIWRVGWKFEVLKIMEIEIIIKMDMWRGKMERL